MKFSICDLINDLKILRSHFICIMSGLGHGTNKYYNSLCKIVKKIDIDIEYYTILAHKNNLEV